MRNTRVHAVRAVWAVGALALLLSAFFLSPARARQAGTMDRAYISRMLDAMHEAASKADGETYFSYYDDGAVFMGTQADERWAMREFKEYALPRFAEGKGWTYVPTTRHIYLNEEGTAGWFDEYLDNEKYGTCRGSGAVIKKNFEWKIVQYNLTVPIPNDLLPGVVEMIREHNKGEQQRLKDLHQKVVDEDRRKREGAAPKP